MLYVANSETDTWLKDTRALGVRTDDMQMHGDHETIDRG